MNPNDEDSWYSQWEQQCETQGPDLDQEYANEQESCRTFLFGHFQESAGAIGHLYAGMFHYNSLSNIAIKDMFWLVTII